MTASHERWPGKSYDQAKAVLKHCIETPNAHVLLVSASPQNAILKILQTLIPSDLHPTWQFNNVRFFLDGTERRIHFQQMNPHAMRGYAPSKIFVESFDWLKEAEQQSHRCANSHDPEVLP